MTRFIVAYFGAGLSFAAVDAIWLTQVGPHLYRPIIGPILADTPNMTAAVAFYLIYILGIVVLAILPTLQGGRWRDATMKGAMLGFTAYATYDLTNQATLRVWSTQLTVLDIAWGTALTGFAATCGYFAARRVRR